MRKLDLNFIVNRRKKLGFTMKYMADKLHISGASSYYKYETGEYKIKADMLPDLAMTLRCNIENFFTK